MGCAKGYMLYDFYQENNKFELRGVDISRYAIGCSPNEIKGKIKCGNAKNLKRCSDNYFDLVISINAIHSFKSVKETEQAVMEIQRVNKGKSYIVVDSYKIKNKKLRVEQWQVAGHIVLSENEWLKIFQKVKYAGDHYFFKP